MPSLWTSFYISIDTACESIMSDEDDIDRRSLWKRHFAYSKSLDREYNDRILGLVMRSYNLFHAKKEGQIIHFDEN